MGIPGADSRFTSLYIAPKGYIEAGATDNYYITKEFTNTSTMKEEWKTDMANLIFTGPGRKSFKTGSADKGVSGFTDNFAWGSLDITEGGVRLLGHLYTDQIRGVPFDDVSKKITNLFGYCGGKIYYNSADPELKDKILTNSYGKQVGHFDATGVYVPDPCI